MTWTSKVQKGQKCPKIQQKKSLWKTEQSFDVSRSDLLSVSRLYVIPTPPAEFTTNSIDWVLERAPTAELIRRFVNVSKTAHRNKSFGNFSSPRSSSACEVMCFDSISNFLVSIFIVFFINSRFRSFFFPFQAQQRVSLKLSWLIFLASICSLPTGMLLIKFIHFSWEISVNLEILPTPLNFSLRQPFLFIPALCTFLHSRNF